MKLKPIISDVNGVSLEEMRQQIPGQKPNIYNFTRNVVHKKGTYHYFIRHCVKTSVTRDPFIWRYVVGTGGDSYYEYDKK